MTLTITSKELRSRFPWVQQQLTLGVSFVVICRSKPVAELRPLDSTNAFRRDPEEASFEDMERASIIDCDDGDYLTPEELKYYLALPDLSHESKS